MPGVGSVRLRLDLRPEAQSGEPAVAFALRVAAMTLPSGMAHPLGPHIASLAVDGALNGPVPLGRTPAERATAWRDGGGSAEIRHLALVWGPLDLTGSATLALDEQLQPMGAASARVLGYAETLDSLATHAAISRSAATAAKAVLSLLANSPGDGSPPDVEVPLTLQVPHPVDAADTSGKAARDRVAVICDRCDRRVRSRNDYPEHHDAN